jgi:hypothetical protein
VSAGIGTPCGADAAALGDRDPSTAEMLRFREAFPSLRMTILGDDNSSGANVAAFWPRFPFGAKRSETNYETPENSGMPD